MHSLASPTARRSRPRNATLRERMAAWIPSLGALAAALLSFGTGGVHLVALAVLAALYLASTLHIRHGARGRDPLGLIPGFLAPALAVGVLTASGLGALEGLLWGGFVRLFLLDQSRV